MTTDELLGLTPDILAELERLGATGAGVERMIQFLHDAGVSKPGAVVALRRKKMIPSAETKSAVHYHPAYGDRRASDEAFQEEAFAVLQDGKPLQGRGSAAA